MAKADLVKKLIKLGKTEEELKELTVAQLNELLPVEEVKKTKGYFLKDEFFGQVITSTDTKSDIPQNAETPVDYRAYQFKGGEIRFVENVPVTKEQLAIMSVYQKDYYLEKR